MEILQVDGKQKTLKDVFQNNVRSHFQLIFDKMVCEKPGCDKKPTPEEKASLNKEIQKHGFLYVAQGAYGATLRPLTQARDKDLQGGIV